MDRVEAEFSSPAGPSGRPTPEECEILDSLDLYHRRGPGPHSADVRWWQVLPFLLACLAVCFGSVFYSDLIPPSLSTLVVGFAVGVLVMVTRREMAFQKRWPLLDRVIDWKLVERIRQDRGAADGRSPDPSGLDLDDLRCTGGPGVGLASTPSEVNMLSRKGLFLLLLVSATGCSRSEPVPTITRAEFDEVRAQRPTEGNPERYLDFIRSDRGRDIVSRRLRNVFSDRGIAIVKGADRVEAYRIKDSRGEGPFGSIEGYPITAVGKGSGAAMARRFVAPLLDGSRYFASLDCYINPGVAYRLRAAEGSVSLVVCYECDSIDVIVRDECGRPTHRGGAFLYDPLGGPKGLVRLAKEAFPDDGEIQELGDRTK